jgi:hypothetical protein
LKLLPLALPKSLLHQTHPTFLTKPTAIPNKEIAYCNNVEKKKRRKIKRNVMKRKPR